MSGGMIDERLLLMPLVKLQIDVSGTVGEEACAIFATSIWRNRVGAHDQQLNI